jgi:hypothetical protein
MRKPRSNKAQKPGHQVTVKSTDRLRIVKMKVEKAGDDTEEAAEDLQESEGVTLRKESS